MHTAAAVVVAAVGIHRIAHHHTVLLVGVAVVGMVAAERTHQDFARRTAVPVQNALPVVDTAVVAAPKVLGIAKALMIAKFQGIK